MELLKNECCIELVNEGFCYMDFICWKDVEKNMIVIGVGLIGQMYGVYMCKDGVGKDDKIVDVDNIFCCYIEMCYFNVFKGYLFLIF